MGKTVVVLMKLWKNAALPAAGGVVTCRLLRDV